MVEKVHENKICIISTSLNQTGCHTKIKEPSLPYYLLIGEGRIVGCISFFRVLALCEMQTALSRF